MSEVTHCDWCNEPMLLGQLSPQIEGGQYYHAAPGLLHDEVIWRVGGQATVSPFEPLPVLLLHTYATDEDNNRRDTCPACMRKFIQGAAVTR